MNDPRLDPGLTRPGAITYLHIPTREPRASATFYRDVFGWTVHDIDGTRPSFDLPGGGLSGAFMVGHPPAGEPGLLPYIYVDDVAATVRQIVEHGGSVHTEPFPEGMLTVAVVRDPTGNVLGLWHDRGGDRQPDAADS